MAIVDDDENDPYPIGADLERRFYLSSRKLMIYFTNQVLMTMMIISCRHIPSCNYLEF